MINHIAQSIYPASGQKDTTVVNLRGNSVDLFGCDDLSKSMWRVSQGKFRGPWPAPKELDNPMFLRVVGDGDRSCV
jgi:hypothetical protein